MKISNNALSFLLAQYRAIFKRAYVKGLASAVILTAGLAAGQAQATVVVNGVEQTDPYIIPGGGTESATIEAGSNDKIFFGHPSPSYEQSVVNNLTINGGHVTGSSTADVDSLAVYGTANLSNITFDLKTGETFTGNSGATYSGRLITDNSVYNVSGGVIQFNKIDLNDNVEVNLGGYNNANQTNFYSNSSNLGVTGTDATLNINAGATINLNDGSSITITRGTTAEQLNTLNLNGGKIVFNASKFVNNFSGTSGTYTEAAVIAGNGNTEINLNAGEVQVNEGKYGEVRGATVNFNGAAVTNDGNLLIAARASASNGSGNGTITIDGSTITNNGTLYLGEALTEHNKTTTTVEAKSGTIDNAAGKVTTVASGTTVNLNGLTFNNAGILDINAGGVVNAVEVANEDLGTDGITNLGGTINVGGYLNVDGTDTSSSTLAIASDAVLTSDTAFKADFEHGKHQGLISVQSGNTLQVSASQLHDFLSSGNKVDFDGDGAQAATNDYAGGLDLQGTVDFGDAVTLSGFTFANDSTLEAGKITVADGGVAKATTVTLNKALTSGSSANKLTVEADTLDLNILTNSDRIALDGNDWNLNFKQATVHSALNLSAAGTDTFTLGNVYNLEAYTTSEAADGTTVYTPASGTVTGVAEVASAGQLKVNAGHWIANKQITAGTSSAGNAIKVAVGNTTDVAAHNFEIDTSLTLAGGLAFDLSSGDAVVSVENNSDLTTDAPVAELDLTAGVAVNGSSNTAKINATSTNGATAVVYMNQSDVNAILSDDTKTNRNLNKIAILLEGAGGTLEVAGSVDADFTDLKSGTGTAGAISFNQGGEFVVDSLTLRGDSSTGDGATAINIGTGVITADSVNLVDKVTPVTDDKGNDRTSVTIASGTLNVGSSLTSNASTLTVSGAGSTLNLETTTDTEQGLITSLDQITLAGGNATVTAGNWLAQVTDFEVQDGSSLTIGGSANADGTYKNASLSANNLTVASTGSVVVADNGTATFNTLDASAAGSGAIEVNNGTLTINGQIGDMNPSNDKAEGGANENHHGVYFGDRNSTRQVFQVTGQVSRILILGRNAVQ